MNLKNYTIQKLFFALIIYCISTTMYGQTTIYTNDMDYVIGDAKQVFIQNKISTQAQADNLLKGFKKMKVNGIRIPIFPRDKNTGVDINPNKPLMDYFYQQALAQGFLIFANPAQGGGGARIANNSLEHEGGVHDVQAATEELIYRVLEFSNEYPDCKWINPFNEDGRATNSTWSVNQYHTIYSTLKGNLNGAELVGPCTWGLPAAIDMMQNTNIADYITVATSHNLGFNHGQWPTFINLAKQKNLPVWDSEVNHNDKNGTGTRLEKAIENKVDGLVLYDSWRTISLTDGSINSSQQEQMLLYLKDYTIPVSIALNGTAIQSSTNPKFNKGPELAIDGDTNGNYGGGSVTVTNSESNPWWAVDLGTEQEIGEIKVFNRTDGCCKSVMSNFTVSVIDSRGITTFSKNYTTYPDPTVTADAEGALGQIIKVQLNVEGALTLAEVQVFAPDTDLSTEIHKQIDVNIFPNPATDKVIVTTPKETFKKFTLYNTNGQTILSNNVNTQELEINVSQLTKGVYILKLEGDRFSGIHKIIKE